jgi:hypothetical protein
LYTLQADVAALGRERTELQNDLRFIRVVGNGPNDVYVEQAAGRDGGRLI